MDEESERDAGTGGPAADRPLSETERVELIRLRAELKDSKAEIAELQMQVEFAKKSSVWVPRTSSAPVTCSFLGWGDRA